ncbi:hypothetical protein [Chryseolinea soli]|uniref:hypothetical protein n=1 Tax=Chryseolinea soli TaxID=2321403 RepID=UPI001358526E|nr:hypothetical protein [Chryseolinea soli]
MKTFFSLRHLIMTVVILSVALSGFISCRNDEPVPSSEKSITSFSFRAAENPNLSSDVQGTISGAAIHCILPAGVSVTALKPTIVHTGNAISPASGVSTDFTNLVNYTVTAQDRSTQAYAISVTVTPPVLSSDKTIASFSFLKTDNPTLSDDVQGTINGQNILCTLPAGVSVTGLKPTVVHTGSSINPASGAAHDFTAPAAYTVTAEDGSTLSYTISVSVSESGPSVYVVGGQRFFGTSYARVWKNGTGANLTNGTYNAYATAVSISGNTFYAAGNQSIGNSFATYWKRENDVELPTPKLNETVNDAYANSIYVSDNNDVYVAGQENHGAGIGFKAKVWKNGVATTLTASSGAAHSVFVSGNDVYVAGWEEITTGWVAKVWKNGVATSLSPVDQRAYGHSVFVSGNDVYVAGQYWNGTTYLICVWKNGTLEIIDPNTPGSDVSSIFVSNGDVYLVGNEIRNNAYNAKVWKNGTGTFLSSSAGSDAKSVYVYDGDVYIAGWEYDSDGKQVATLWKNGVASPLATDAFAYSVIVK